MNLDSKIYVAGHNGMVGSSIVRKLKSEGYNNLILKSHVELDLINQKETSDFFNHYRPEYVFLAAAKVGGIYANNTYPADFVYNNLQIQNNVIYNSFNYNVKKLLFLGSSCIYPRECPQPIKEEYLLSGYLEKTNDAYAISKIAGIKMCQSYNKQYDTNFISVMPTNLYGIGDNYHSVNSHVFPALIKKFHEAKINNDRGVTLWGTGKALREFLYVDDLAEALLFLMKNYNDSEIINVGTGKDLSILHLAYLIKEEIDFKGDIVFDYSKPDGTPQKLLDVSKIQSLGWHHKIDIKEGIKITYNDYIKNVNN